MRKIMVEFFSGSCRMAKAFENLGYEIITIDNNEKLNPSIVADILNFHVKSLNLGEFDKLVLWFGVPCTTFSVASLRHYWTNGKPKSYKTYIGLALAKKCLEIIEELKPTYWFIENPRGMLRKQDFMPNEFRRTLTYCQYGDDVQKPTDIWSNLVEWISKKPCGPGDNCHLSAKRGEDKGTQARSGTFERAVYPFGLCEEVSKACEGLQIVKQSSLNNYNEYTDNGKNN